MGATISLLRNAGNQSFMIPKPALTEKTLPDQSGKVFIITGANTGVGYEVSRILYTLNGTVYMGCRSESKAKTAIDNIKAAVPNSTGKLVYLHLDLGDLSTIKASAETFKSQESRLDWLDNNAGVMMPPLGSKTTSGHELQHGTNVLGPFLFTKLLLPVLKSTASQAGVENGTARVSWAGSFATDGFSPKNGMQFNPDGSLKDLNDPGALYGSTKAANWFLAHEFGQRYGTRDGVLHNAYNPGNLKSDLARYMNPVAGKFLEWFVLFPAVYGAYTEIWAGFSRDLAIERDQGGYVIPWGRKSTWNREDVKLAMREGGASEKLWAWCEAETRQYA